MWGIPYVRLVSHPVRPSAGSLRASGCPCAGRATALPATWAPSVVAGGSYLFIPLRVRVQSPFLAHSVCCSVTHAVPRVARLPLSGSCTRSERVRHKPLRGQRLSLTLLFFSATALCRGALLRLFPLGVVARGLPASDGLRMPANSRPYFSAGALCYAMQKRASRAPLGRKNAPSPTLRPLNYPK